MILVPPSAMGASTWRGRGTGNSWVSCFAILYGIKSTSVTTWKVGLKGMESMAAGQALTWQSRQLGGITHTCTRAHTYAQTWTWKPIISLRNGAPHSDRDVKAISFLCHWLGRCKCYLEAVRGGIHSHSPLVLEKSVEWTLEVLLCLCRYKNDLIFTVSGDSYRDLEECEMDHEL